MAGIHYPILVDRPGDGKVGTSCSPSITYPLLDMVRREVSIRNLLLGLLYDLPFYGSSSLRSFRKDIDCLSDREWKILIKCCVDNIGWVVWRLRSSYSPQRFPVFDSTRRTEGSFYTYTCDVSWQKPGIPKRSSSPLSPFLAFAPGLSIVTFSSTCNPPSLAWGEMRMNTNLISQTDSN